MFNIKLAPRTHEDLAEIKEYISRDDENTATSVVAEIYDKIGVLADNPNLGVSLESKTGIPTKYRYLICKPYLIFYKIEGKHINVYRVLHGMRDYLKILDL